MQTEKSQLEGKRIMPESRFTAFPALSVDLRVGISDLRRRPIIDYFSYLLFVVFFKRYMTANSECHSEVFVTACKHRL